MSHRKATVHPERDLKPLRLPPTARHYAKVAPPCQADRADHPTCLLRLAEREVQDCEVWPADRQSKAARLRPARTLGRPDFGAQPSTNRALVREPSQATAVLLDGHEHLRRVQVAQPDETAYGALLARGGAR